MTIWELVQTHNNSDGSQIEDIIGYFRTEKDAKEAKKIWDKDNLENENRVECTRIHTTELWDSIEDFEEFWFSTKSGSNDNMEEHY
jgi:hypothetical protein